MVVLESAPEKALEATVDKWLEWDLGETRQEVTREKKFFGCHLLEVCLILVPPPSWPFFSGVATTSDMFLTNDWAWDDLGIIITAFAILTIVSISQVQRLLDDGDWTELAKIMAPRLEFGTAGIRGRMGAGFGRMNDLVIIQVYKCALSLLSWF